MSAAAVAEAPAKTDEKKKRSDEKKKHPRDPAREVIETIVFVVVLVLLLKLFVTEAFVIPTGSMAETLYGYQKIITCPKCNHEFPVNSHDEVEVNAQTKRRHPMIKYCCPNCRHEGRVDDLNPLPQNRTGDRVLVLKPLYHLRQQQRGDVVVFKFPEEPQQQHTAQNYIKRAMGFGRETVAIHRGELYVTSSLSYPDDDPMFPRPENALDLWRKLYMYENSSHAEALFKASRQAGFTDKVPGGFRIVRKGEDQMLADRRIVWDNDKQPADLGRAAQRWVYANEAAWTTDNVKQPRAFTHKGESLDWLRYRHVVWQSDGAGKLLLKSRPHGDSTPRLVPWRWPNPARTVPTAGPIDNMLGYNAGTDLNARGEEVSRDDPNANSDMPQQLWVGDLLLECEVELAAGSEVTLELSKGNDRFQAKFGNSSVTLSRVGSGDIASRPCKVNAGNYRLRFANVDAQLAVWVDDKRIDFGTEGEYNPTEVINYEPEDTLKEGWTRANDIEAPASIGAKGQVSAVRGIKLWRDIYYTRTRPSDHTGADIFYVQPGHYMCLGDNSAQSSDSRSWGVVPERLMLGKAVFIFWPGMPSPNRVGFIK